MIDFALLAVFVALTEHVIESRHLTLAALDFAGLFKVTLLPDVAYDSFAVELFLQTAQGFFHRFSFAEFYFY